jgi:segregation and condensation protein A
MLDREVFVREDLEVYSQPSRAAEPLEVGIGELVCALRDLLERTTRRDLLEIEPDRLSVKDKINELLERLKQREWLTFVSLFDEDTTRINLLTTFLALLELVKLQLVRIYQDKPFGTILISRRFAPQDYGDRSPAPLQ